MAPFEREMTSYSILMVTLALSASVSKLQPPPRNTLDLLLTSSGHVSSKPMAPFEREPMTSYSIFNHGPICKRFQVTALQKMLDLVLTSFGHGGKICLGHLKDNV